METYRHYLYENSEYGICIEVRHPIVIVNGLPNVKIDEIVIFEEGQIGQVFSIAKDNIEILMYSQSKVGNGASVTRTQKSVSIPVGHHLLGKIITPLGDFIDGNQFTDMDINDIEYRPIDNEALDIPYRVKVSEAFFTGTSVVDQIIPLGKGQRELIIGDRKSGKTSFLLTAIKNQMTEDTVIIYGAIGRKQSEIKKIENFLEEENLMSRTVIVSTTSDDSPGYIYLTPYSAMTIAEYFRDLGKDVVVILDDLTYHAKIYREISLLANRFPGRDAYPGDIFYLHSKLLERAGTFKHKDRAAVNITCFPIAETVEGDLRGYISTNLMGMTDGHIFFDSNIYSQGIRPAINTELSVTRVGRQTRNSLQKEITTTLSSFLARYNKLINFSHFGSELSEEIEGILKRGEYLLGFFNQGYKFPIPIDVQLLMIGLIWKDFFKQNTIDEMKKVRDHFVHEYNTESTFIKNLVSVESLVELNKNLDANLSQIQEICKASQK